MIRLTLTLATLISCGCGGIQVDRSQLPGPAKRADWEQPGITTWKLENGLKVWYVRQSQAPLVAMNLVLPTGAATDPAGRAGTMSLMADMLDEGAGGLGALQISDKLAQLATTYSARVGTDSTTLSMSMLVENLEPSLDLLAQFVTQADFPETDFKRVKAQRDASALNAQSNPQTIGFVVTRRVMLGDGYGAFPPNGVRRTLGQVSLKDVKAAFAKFVKPDGATLVIVGAAPRDVLEAALKKSLGAWSGTAPAFKPTLGAKPKQPGIHLVDFPGSAQSMVIAARSGGTTTAPDYFQSKVFNRAFAGAFTARVNMNLREDKGYTYGARGQFVRMKHAGNYLIYAKVKRETTKASIDEILKEIGFLRGDKPLAPSEIETAKSGMVKGYPGRFERMSNVAGELAGVVSAGHDVDWYTNRIKKIAEVTPQQAIASSVQYAVSDDFQIIVVGDRAKILGGLKSYGRPIALYDAQGDFLKTIDNFKSQK